MQVLVISKRETAKALSVSVRSVERLIADGSLPAVRIRGQVRIPVGAVEQIARGVQARNAA
jgi:excisionase family DNA binding protein